MNNIKQIDTNNLTNNNNIKSDALNLNDTDLIEKANLLEGKCKCCSKDLETGKEKITEPICVYTDGSHFLNKGKSIGCGLGVYFNPNCYLNEGCPLHLITKVGPRTVGRAEIAACIRALQILKPFEKWPVVIHSDSSYVVNTLNHNINNCIIRHWKNAKGQLMMDWDLLQELYLMVKSWKNKVTFVKVKGHDEVIENQMADFLAKQGAQLDIGFEYIKHAKF